MRVEVLDAPRDTDNKAEPTLFGETKDLVGKVSFEPTDLSERSEEYYAQPIDEKYPQGNK